jgi:hypothetical protein
MINPLEDRHLKLLAVMQQLLADIRGVVWDGYTWVDACY